MPVSSIRSRLIISLTVILTAAFLATSLVNYQIAKRAIRQEILTSALPLTRDTIYSEIERDLVRPIHISSLMANDSFLKDWRLGGEKNVDEIARYLKEIQEKYGFFSTFFVSTGSRNYYYPGGVLKTISPGDEHDVWYYRFLYKAVSYDLEVDSNQAAKDALTIFINHKVIRGGKILGVTGVGLKLDTVSALIRSYQEKYHRGILLVDPEGVIQVGGDPGQSRRSSIYDLPGLDRIAAKILSVRAGSREMEYDRDGRHFLLTVRYIPDFNWFLVVQQDETASLAEARSGFYRTLGAGLAATVLVILVCLFTVNLFQSRLERMAATDELTGAGNRRAFERRFAEAVRAGSGRGTPLSLALLDIDRFKSVNDRLGHLAGDAILKAVTGIAKACVRPSDFVARWGGDEFLIMVMADAVRTREIAERLEERVRETDFAEILGLDGPVSVTVSCGSAQYADGDSLDDLIAKADKAMYAAKGTLPTDCP